MGNFNYREYSSVPRPKSTPSPMQQALAKQIPCEHEGVTGLMSAEEYARIHAGGASRISDQTSNDVRRILGVKK